MLPLQIPAHINHPLVPFQEHLVRPPPPQPPPQPQPRTRPVPAEGGTAGSPAPCCMAACELWGGKCKNKACLWAGVPQSPEQIQNPGGASAQDGHRAPWPCWGLLLLLLLLLLPRLVEAAGGSPLDLVFPPPQGAWGPSPRWPVWGSPVSCPPPQALIWRICWWTHAWTLQVGRKPGARLGQGGGGGGGGNGLPRGAAPEPSPYLVKSVAEGAGVSGSP